MAKLFDIPKLRPCMVAQRLGGKEEKALFHCWEHYANVVGESMLKGGHPAGQISETYGIVEMEDGTVKQVYPNLIRFLDPQHKEYDFTDPQKVD